jgi:hypothetical protein
VFAALVVLASFGALGRSTSVAYSLGIVPEFGVGEATF